MPCVPLRAWLVWIDRNKHLGQRARLPCIHEYMRTGPYEIRRRLCRIDKEEAIGKLVALDSGFSARDAQAPDVLRLVSAHGNEICGELLRVRHAGNCQAGRNEQAGY
jgi:hypothetical protein